MYSILHIPTGLYVKHVRRLSCDNIAVYLGNNPMWFRPDQIVSFYSEATSFFYAEMTIQQTKFSPMLYNELELIELP